MLVAMLRYAGIDANPILLSTRSNGIVIFPTTNAFNYVIAGVEILNDVIMLDATNKNSLPDIISIEALNWSGRIVRESGSSTDVNLIDIAPSLEVNTVLCELDKEGVLKGEIRRQYYDYNAYLYKNYGLKLSQEERVKRIEKKYHDIFIDQYSLKDENNSITEQFSFEHSNISEKIGDKIYISPALFYNITENPFKSSVRKYPVDFQFPYEDKYKISIKIPDGYSIDKIPKPISLSLNGGYANYMLKVNKNGKFIQVIMNFAINTMFIPATEYDLLKTFYNEIIKTHEDYIILLKD